MRELNPEEVSSEEKREGKTLGGLLENLFRGLISEELGLGLAQDLETREWVVVITRSKEDQTALLILRVEEILLNKSLLKTKDFLKAIHLLADEAIKKVEGMKRNN